MKCYLEKCINNDEWACMYRSDCVDCNRGCKNYYQCSSCDYYMDEELEEEFQQGGEIEDALWFYDDGCTEVIIPESHSDFRLLCQCANCKHEWKFYKTVYEYKSIIKYFTCLKCGEMKLIKVS